MKTHAKTAIAAISASIILILAASPANASSDQPIAASVAGGGVSAVVSAVSLSNVTLDGTSAKHAAGVAASGWSVTDARGTGSAWGLTVSGTDFTSAAGDTDLTVRTLPIGNLVITAGTITAGTGADAAPATAVVTTSAIDQSMLVSSENHKGTYTFTPSFDLQVPINAFRSNFVHGTSGAVNPYVATLTFTVA